MQETYFGRDRSRYAAQSTVLALAASGVPCLFTISQFDPPLFHAQLSAVFAARVAMRGRSPQVLYLRGHNHFSSSLQLGSTIDTLGPALAALVDSTHG
jgi:triacylglycerol lipase